MAVEEADLDAVRDALNRLLWELPAEFGDPPGGSESRAEFRVLGKHNVRKVHRALWDLQVAVGLKPQ